MIHYKLLTSGLNTPTVIDASCLAVGELARIVELGGTKNPIYSQVGHIVTRTWGNVVVSLNNPELTWSLPANMKVERLKSGERITLEVI